MLFSPLSQRTPQMFQIILDSLCLKLVGCEDVRQRHYFLPVNRQQVLWNVLKQREKPALYLGSCVDQTADSSAVISAVYISSSGKHSVSFLHNDPATSPLTLCLGIPVMCRK